MKTLSKYLPGIALAGLISAAIVTPASAQRGFHGGGGGVHVSGGIGFGGFHSGIGFGFRSGLGYRNGTYIGGRVFYGYPTIGYHFGYLPLGYYPFYWGSDLYYYYGGVFYHPYDDGGYEVTNPPVGAAVPDLPRGAQSIVINNQQYYEYNGVYYQATTDDKGKTVYVVAGKDGVLNTNSSDENVNNPPPAPQVGDVVNQLPDGSRKISLNGKRYFVSPDGIYYEEFRDSHDFKAYRIVSIPSDDDNQPEQHQQ